jgi:hypothetical protein
MRRMWVPPSERAGRKVMGVGSQLVHQRAVEALPVSWKVHVFDPVTAYTNILSTQQNVEFTFTANKMSEIQQILLYYTLSNGDATDTAVVMPSWFHCDAVEIEQGGETFTLYPEWQHFVYEALRPTEWGTLTAADIGIDSAYDEISTTTIAAAGGTDTFVMPLWSVFQQADVPMGKLKGDIRIRYKFTTFAMAEVAGSVASGDLTCTAMKLYIIDRHLKPPFDTQQLADTREVVLPYLEVSRELYYASLTSATRVDIKPASVTGNVAFVMMGVRVTAASNDTLLAFSQITDYTIKDPGGNIIGNVQQYPMAIQRFEIGEQVANPGFLASIPWTIISFTSDLTGTMLKGVQAGVETLPMNTMININPSAGSATAYDIVIMVGKYRQLLIKDGLMKVIRS